MQEPVVEQTPQEPVVVIIPEVKLEVKPPVVYIKSTENDKLTVTIAEGLNFDMTDVSIVVNYKILGEEDLAGNALVLIEEGVSEYEIQLTDLEPDTSYSVVVELADENNPNEPISTISATLLTNA